MRNMKPERQVLQQSLALDSYLRTLLEGIPGELDALDEEVVEDKPVQALIQKKEINAKSVVIPKTDVKEKIAPASTPIIVPALEQKIMPLSVMPAWAQQEFQALFFKVDNMTLAAPLVDLLRTIKIEKSPTRIPGQPSWFMGLLDTQQERIGVLDTGQLIFGKTIGGRRNLIEQPYKNILMTHDGCWGLACDEVLTIGRLVPDKVRWRTYRPKRPWLVGTVIDELTAIIDVNRLVPQRKKR